MRGKGLNIGEEACPLRHQKVPHAPRAIAAYAAAHPRIDVKLTVGNREEIIAALERFDLDIATASYRSIRSSMAQEQRTMSARQMRRTARVSK